MRFEVQIHLLAQWSLCKQVCFFEVPSLMVPQWINQGCAGSVLYLSVALFRIDHQWTFASLSNYICLAWTSFCSLCLSTFASVCARVEICVNDLIVKVIDPLSESMWRKCMRLNENVSKWNYIHICDHLRSFQHAFEYKLSQMCAKMCLNSTHLSSKSTQKPTKMCTNVRKCTQNLP